LLANTIINHLSCFHNILFFSFGEMQRKILAKLPNI